MKVFGPCMRETSLNNGTDNKIFTGLQQNQIKSLSYSETDVNAYNLPPVTRPTTTTVAPEATTKKKGIFSGWFGGGSKDKETTTVEPTTTTTTTTVAPEVTTKKKGFFSGIFGGSKDKETTTVPPTTTTTIRTTTTTKAAVPVQVTTTTVRSAPQTPPSVIPTFKPAVVQVTTTTVRSAPQTPPPAIPTYKPAVVQVTTTTARPVTPVTPRKATIDEFPTLPTQAPSGSKSPSNVPVTPPNAWNLPVAPASTPSSAWPKLPGQAEPGSASRPGSPTSTASSTWPKLPGQSDSQTPPPSNAWNNKPAAGGSAPQIPPRFDAPTRAPVAPASVSSGPVTDAELLTLSESLFSKETNNPFKYVTVNYQGRTYSSGTTDEASQPLLSIDERVYTMGTVEKMIIMFNNYEQDTMINEYVTPLEKKEENEFVDAVLATPVMRHAMNFLQQKGSVTLDPITHRDLLRTIWFNMYSRGQGKIGSSGFEHVFLSEVRNASVIGLHNWVYLADQEKSGDLDYQGYTKKIDLGNKGQIAKIRFTLNGLNKPTNSLFIGTSPELEMALYTVCFELRADKDCRMSYGGSAFNIVTHSFRYRSKNLIGSAYPEI
ncbi:unnamed protein product [Diamesa tonsa]